MGVCGIVGLVMPAEDGAGGAEPLREGPAELEPRATGVDGGSSELRLDNESDGSPVNSPKAPTKSVWIVSSQFMN